MPTTDFEILAFRSAADWERWLEKHHTTTPGVWLRFFRQASGVASVDYAGALSAALCHGWIDGQVKKHDEQSWLQKFTPRRPNSTWSKRNCGFVAQLTAAGKMRPAGIAAMEAAKADGRWAAAYDSPGNMSVPEDLLRALAKNKKAKAFFATLNRTNIYAITWRLQTARKSETRAKRMQAIIEMLTAEKKFHS